MEGTCSGRYGYIVTVMNLINRSPGAIRDGTGFATFQVNFQALVFRPFKDEVLPASVDVVNKVGTAATGPGAAKLSEAALLQMVRAFCGNKTRLPAQPVCWLASSARAANSLMCSAGSCMQVGFFCTSGPLKMFVSTHLIPEEFKYETEDEPAFVSSDEEVRIRAGSNVRVRIVGVRLDANECVRSLLAAVLAQQAGRPVVHLTCAWML